MLCRLSKDTASKEAATGTASMDKAPRPLSTNHNVNHTRLIKKL